MAAVRPGRGTDRECRGLPDGRLPHLSRSSPASPPSAGPSPLAGRVRIADVATGRPVTVGMRHRVGSITETFTAAAVLRQAESGQLGLDTPTGRNLPKPVPDNAVPRSRFTAPHRDAFAARPLPQAAAPPDRRRAYDAVPRGDVRLTRNSGGGRYDRARIRGHRRGGGQREPEVPSLRRDKAHRSPSMIRVEQNTPLGDVCTPARH
jgi:hypothetical protein